MTEPIVRLIETPLGLVHVNPDGAGGAMIRTEHAVINGVPYRFNATVYQARDFRNENALRWYTRVGDLTRTDGSYNNPTRKATEAVYALAPIVGAWLEAHPAETRQNRIASYERAIDYAQKDIDLEIEYFLRTLNKKDARVAELRAELAKAQEGE